MRLKRTDEFQKDAVRIALTSGLTRKQVADDLGIGMSMLNKWITSHPTARQCLFAGTRGKEQSRLSLGSYDRLRMTEELKEIGLDVGHPLPAGDCM